MLTRTEIDEIREIIRTHILAFTRDALGDGELSPDELAILERAGIVRRSERHLITDPYEFGKIAALVGPTSVRAMNFESVKRAVSKLAPMTEVEEQAINYASTSAGQYIRGIGDMMLKDTTAATASSGGAALRAVQDGVSEAIANRQTISELRSTLFHAIDNRDRDWQRIAHTEMGNSIQRGIYNEIRDKSSVGADQLIYKRPNPDACKYCKGLYLSADGITPKIFRLSDLEDNNVGRKARDWQPVMGTTHPWCNCQIHYIPEGHDFVHEWTVKEPFDSGGESYKRGQIIPNTEYASLSADFGDNIERDAILRFTGTTARLSASKGMDNVPIHGDIDEPICEH